MTKESGAHQNEAKGMLTIDQMHTESVQWISEINFYKSEFVFLSGLLNKYFLRISLPEIETDLKKLQQKIKVFEHSPFKIAEESILNHEYNLGLLMENENDVLLKSITEEHRSFGIVINRLGIEARHIKSDIFEFVERQIKLCKEIDTGYEEGNLTL